AGWEPRQDRLTLSDRCDSVQVLGANTGLYELVADMDRVLDTDSEADRSPALAVLQPMLDHVTDQVVSVHATLKLTDNVVALLSSNATEIGIDRRIDSRPHQKAAYDQVRDLRALDHRVEDVAETATVASARCRGHAEQRRVRIERDQLLASSTTSAVRLIEDQEIGRRQRHRLGAHAANVQRVDARDLHQLHRPGLHAGHDDAVAHAVGGQLGASLRDDLATMREEQHG